MVSALAFTVAPANGGVYVFPRFRVNVPGKGLIPLLATGARVTGIHSLVWLKYVSVGTHFLKNCLALGTSGISGTSGIFLVP